MCLYLLFILIIFCGIIEIEKLVQKEETTFPPPPNFLACDKTRC